MLSLVLRGFMQRKLRVLLTGIAIALGVALMAGTYVLTDTINKSFAGIFQVANRGHAVVITPKQSLGRETRAQTSPITDQMLAQVRGTSGVAEAAGSIFTPGTFLDVHRKRLTNGGAPAFVASETPKRFGTQEIRNVHNDSCALRHVDGNLVMFLAIARVSKFAYVEFFDRAGKMEGAPSTYLRGLRRA